MTLDKRKMRKIKKAGIAMILLFVLLGAGCGNNSSEVKEPKEEKKEERIEEKAKEPEKEPKEEEKEEETSGIASPSVNGVLHVEGTKLVGANGENVQLKGISTHGIAWFPDYINEECFRQFHEEWKANVIRLAMYTAESGGYCTDGDKEKLKDLVKSGVEFASAQDMYVIIDWHILSDSNPNMHLEEAKAFFTEMSETYRDAKNVLFEICNEPNNGTTWQDVKSYAEEIIGVIRSNKEDAVILVGTPNWCQYVDEAAADPITTYDNIMYTLHFYAATHTDDLRTRMKSAIDAGLPIFVSEYGICDASGNGAIDEAQANQWVALMDEYEISYVAWNLSNKAESSAILLSTCTKTSGFGEEDFSTSGIWLRNMLTGEAENAAGSADGSDAEKPAAVAGQGNFVWQSGDMEVSSSIKNSWDEGGTPVSQYELILRNTSGKSCTSWEVDVPFQEEITLSDGWNGEYSVQGKTLHITSKDYNGAVPEGGSVTDIGFIIKGRNGIELL